MTSRVHTARIQYFIALWSQGAHRRYRLDRLYIDWVPPRQWRHQFDLSNFLLHDLESLINLLLRCQYLISDAKLYRDSSALVANTAAAVIWCVSNLFDIRSDTKLRDRINLHWLLLHMMSTSTPGIIPLPLLIDYLRAVWGIALQIISTEGCIHHVN